MESQLSVRKTLNHKPPAWVPDAEVYFITINSLPRGGKQLVDQGNGYAILETARHYHHIQKWHCHLLLIMPDHLHALASFPSNVAIKTFINSWKGYLAKNNQIRWQRDFFDHRVRNDENQDVKANYIRKNPVRTGLVEEYEKWPWRWESKR